MAPPDEPDRPRGPDGEEPNRNLANLVMLLFFVAIVGVGVWLANVMVDQKKMDDCVASGRRNCAPIDVPMRVR